MPAAAASLGHPNWLRGYTQHQLQLTPNGVVVTETTEDAGMVKVIHAHAQEITGFAEEGIPAMMQGMMRGMMQ